MTSATRPLTGPMYDRRPAWLERRIEETYGREAAYPGGYALMSPRHGTDRTYCIAGADTGVLACTLRERLGRPLRVLDVGTGTGIPVAHHTLEMGDTAQGISAFDYRQWNPWHVLKDDNETYVVGNAERMYELTALLPEYDLVMSRDLMHHVVDPLGTFEQIANRVGQHGLLCVDDFDFSDNPDRRQVTASRIYAAMGEAGFALLEGGTFSEAELALSGLPEAVWQRQEASRPVRFPIDYARSPNGHLTYII